jgi:tetratricopeptide (TPR) repeat protein
MPPSGSPTAALFQEAQRQLQAGDRAAAIALYRRILDINPEHADARHYLGMALCFEGDLPAGLPHLHASIALRPTDAIYHNNLGLWLEQSGDLDLAARVLQRAVALRADDREARLNLARIQIRRTRYAHARDQLQEALRLEPQDPEVRLLLADVLDRLGEFEAMQREYGRILAERPQHTGVRLQFAERLAALGLDDQVLRECARVLEQEPGNVTALMMTAYVEERRGRLDSAAQIAGRVLDLRPGHGPALVQLARLRRIDKDIAGAEALLAQTGPAVQPNNVALVKYWIELGMLRDRQDRVDEAFDCFRHSKEALRSNALLMSEIPRYQPDEMARKYDALRRLVASGALAPLAALAPPPAGNRPLFVTGFPRSGTTLVEQMLSMHPAIHAGGELTALSLVEAQAQVRLGSAREYPDCLPDVAGPGNSGVLRELRDAYLDLARQAGAIEPGAKYFTDKATLNETRLPLIRLLFPDSPVVHVLRHPLDIVLSIFQNELRHPYSLDIESIARHYVLVMSLVDDLLTGMPDRHYLRVRYEDLVQNPEPELRRLLDGIGEPWDPRCLEFQSSARVARTISYAQVRQPLYASSRMRWRRYRRQLEPIIPVLEPLAVRLGYSLE